MKKFYKYFLLFVMAVFLVIPTTVFASNTVNVYVFYGEGDTHSKELIDYLDKLKKDSNYKNKFDVVKYEVWSNKENATLMQNVAKELTTSASGVPFYVIGEYYQSGFPNLTSTDESVQATVKKVTNELKTEINNSYERIRNNQNYVDLIEKIKNKASTNCIGGPEGTNCGSVEDIAPLISPSEENTTDQAFYVDEDLNVTKDIDASAFMIGNTIKSSGTIYGSHFAAGNELNISGFSDYSFFAGQNLKIHNYNTNDGFIAGKDIEFDNVLGRTFYVAAQKITVSNSNFNKLYLAGEKVVLNGEFNDVTVSADKVVVNGTIKGTLEINESAKLDTDANTSIATINKYKDSEKSNKFSKGNTFAALLFVIVVAFIKGYVNLALIGVIIIACFKKTVKKLNKEDIDASFVFSRIGIGLCTLIVVPVVSIIALFTGVASLIGVILLLAYIVGIIISTPIVTIYLSDKLLKSIKNDYLRYLVGLLILQLIKKVPVIGGLVTFLSLLLGLGLIIQLMKQEKKEK